MQITDQKLAVQQDTHSYTHSFTPTEPPQGPEESQCVNHLHSSTLIFFAVQNIQQVRELMSGISALFKVIYLGETGTLNPLTV